MAVRTGRYGGLSAEERAAVRREQLIEATLEVWGRAGGPRVTMTLVCAEAGLTERYFYESFARLDEALSAVLEQISAEITTAGLAAIASTQGGPGERVRAAIAAYVDVITSDPRKGRVAVLEAPGWPELRAQRTGLSRSFAALVAQEGRDLYGDLALEPREAELNALMFIGGVQELVTAWLDGGIDASPAEIVDVATAAFTSTGHR
ncbi:MAG: TetR/AcrR family transcriptional regulator [Actinobacteria bacterium]|uniref:Unannotated protein n=1 Tax=freshwater metagenome TaxID=449393 RepID=A0A6J6P056_9ZZZZ|nr:TetR/AcrR family transcriptional regulator [Actinomycetota bacterium]